VLTLFTVIAASACADHEADPVADEAAAISTTRFHLPGFSEKLLVADRTGKIAIAQLGDTTKIAKVRQSLGAPVVGVRSRAGRFWVLGANGALASIDPSKGLMSKAVTVAAKGARDLELESDDVAWISARDEARLVRVRIGTGATEDAVSFADRAIEGGRVLPQAMARVGDHLFVHLARETKEGAPQRGALAIVDVPTKHVTAVVELEVPHAGGAAEIGYDPDGPMVVDSLHGKLLFTALGARPADTGMILRLDLQTLKLDPWLNRFGAGFQGAITLGAEPHDPEMYIGYHTSTPQPSTHIFHFRLGGDGEPTSVSNETVIETFEVVDNYPMNQARTLLAFPVECSLAFCTGGAGLSLVNVKTAKPYPRLGETDLGLKPSFAAFL
jgi:hypothetical protein